MLVIVAPLIQRKHRQADFVQVSQAYDTGAEQNVRAAANPQGATTHLFASGRGHQEVDLVAKDIEQAGNVAQGEAEQAVRITADLNMAQDAAEVQKGSQEIVTAASQSGSAAIQFKTGTHEIAPAAQMHSSVVKEQKSPRRSA